MMSLPVEADDKRVAYARRPELRQFRDAIQARSACQRALQRGGRRDLPG